MSYCGPIHPQFLVAFRHFIETLAGQPDKRDTLNIFIRTGGGSAEMVEKMVEIVRHHYTTVHFVVPDVAMSAGTIWCMSGDKIFMDYSSSLGPIDPQVPVKGSGEYVPAMGYLDQYERLIEKSRNGTLTPVEYGVIQSQDQGVLARYEQARDLSVSLLKKWLVEYKFKDWTVHRKDGQNRPVTAEEKAERAEQIAKLLGNHKLWNSHGRMIGINTLRTEAKLDIEDYSADVDLRTAIRSYHDLLTDYMQRQKRDFVVHSKNVFS